MGVSGDASEQIVRLSLEGFEVLAKLTGSGAKNIAVMLYTILKDQKQTKGKTRLNNMLKSGKPLKIFSIKNEDLERFKYEAKKYGILYCALVDRKNKNIDGMTDIMVKDEDSSRVNRIVERFKLTTVDTVKVDTEVTKSIEKREAQKKELGILEKSKEEQLKEILSKNHIAKEKTTVGNFNSAKTKNPQSEPFLKALKMQEGVSKREKKPSVRKELAKLKVEVKRREENRAKEKDNIKITSPKENEKQER